MAKQEITLKGLDGHEDHLVYDVADGQIQARIRGADVTISEVSEPERKEAVGRIAHRSYSVLRGEYGTR